MAYKYVANELNQGIKQAASGRRRTKTGGMAGWHGLWPVLPAQLPSQMVHGGLQATAFEGGQQTVLAPQSCMQSASLFLPAPAQAVAS